MGEGNNRWVEELRTQQDQQKDWQIQFQKAMEERLQSIEKKQYLQGKTLETVQQNAAIAKYKQQKACPSKYRQNLIASRQMEIILEKMDKFLSTNENGLTTEEKTFNEISIKDAYIYASEDSDITYRLYILLLF